MKRLANNPATCARKRRHSDWDEARRAGLRVSQENPTDRDANAVPVLDRRREALPRRTHQVRADQPAHREEERSMSDYRCNHCNKVVTRESDKRWIKSLCGDTGKTTRLWRVTSPRGEQGRESGGAA